MTATLYIGDRSYSSWSLRGWLLFRKFGLPVDLVHVDFNAGSVAEQMAKVPPARTVPTAVMEDGSVLWESLALAEELAARHPEAGMWPSDPAARATGRSLAAEMHSGFSALRTDCPMNLRVSYGDVPHAAEVLADVARIEEIWAFSRARHGAGGPWLLGQYSIADAFFAPVAGRIAGYGLAVGAEAQRYVDAHLADTAFRQWRAMGIARGARLT